MDCQQDRVTLVFHDGKCFTTKKRILIKNSRVFEAMFKHEDCTEVKISDVDFMTMQNAIKILWGEKLLDRNLDEQLLKVSDKYEMTKVMKQCENKLMKELSRENIFSTYFTAEFYNAKTLQERCINFMMNDWINLPKPKYESLNDLERKQMYSLHQLIIFRQASQEIKWSGFRTKVKEIGDSFQRSYKMLKKTY